MTHTLPWRDNLRWDYPFAKGHNGTPKDGSCLSQNRHSDTHQNSSQGFHVQEQMVMSSQDIPEEDKVGQREGSFSS